MVQKLMMALVGLALLVATAASAADEINWQLNMQGEKVSLVRKTTVVDVTDEAATYGEKKIREAYESKGAIVPLEKSLQKAFMIHLFYSQSDFIATKWLVYDAPRNLIGVREGLTPYTEYYFNPLLILWLIMLFTISISFAMKKIRYAADAALIKRDATYFLISAITWTAFCLITWVTITWIGLVLWVLPLVFNYSHPHTRKKLLASDFQINITWYLIMLLALVVIS